MAAENGDILHLPKLLHPLLIQHPALWGHINDMRLFAKMCRQVVNAQGDGLGHQQHSLAAAKGAVVHSLVFVKGKIPDLVAAYLQISFF